VEEVYRGFVLFVSAMISVYTHISMTRKKIRKLEKVKKMSWIKNFGSDSQE
jgi:hypothetical protein